ncbi:hypothetical protein [Mycobacterium sp. TKK-01-0059]|uniref:hypothetical protein n=1 Tax=Mycobacterium sp. TKK-01-0059 TaxID=1324269 RepID=UPI0012DEA5D9|nr:hypothetical protein [Mycobacterium sp. TKK-01-0059]
MSMQEVRVVEGYYTCPSAFTVAISALSVPYSAVVGGHNVSITLPTVAGVPRDNQELVEPAWHYSEHDMSLSRLPEMAPFWGRVVVFGPDGQTPKAVSVNRFRIAFDAVGDDEQVRGLSRAIAEAMPVWWKQVSTWIEVLYGQDLSRLGPIEPGISFNATTLWTRLHTLHGRPIHGGGHVLPVGSAGFNVVMPNYRPITGDALKRCIRHAVDNDRLADEWLVVRDAKSLWAGRDYRRAVLDSGLAAELAVTRLITDHLTAIGKTAAEIKRLLRANSMLTPLCRYWLKECGGTLPADYAVRLIRRRNAATHAGQIFAESEVAEAIDVAASIVAQAAPLPR